MSLLYDCADPDDRERGLSAAVAAAKRGDLIVMPTDTVYGLGTDAFSSSGVAKLREVKGRGRDLPVPVMVPSRRAMESLTGSLSQAARDLAIAFWPGALTLVCRASSSLAWDLDDGEGSVAIRMPLHPVALEVLSQVGPMAVSTAARVGEPVAVRAADARLALTDSVSVYLDAGPSPDSPASSVVDVTGPIARLVREGALSRALLAEVVAELE